MDFLIPIGIPILFAVFSALFQFVANLTKGEQKFRVWVRQQENGESILVLHQGQTTTGISGLKNLVDIDRLAGFDVILAPVGIDLVIGAFALYAAALIRATGTAESMLGVLVVDIGALIAVVILGALVNLVGPDETRIKTGCTAGAILTGIAAMAISFLVV